MKIESDSKQSWISIVVVGAIDAPDIYPNLRLSIAVADEGFCGAYDHVNVTLDQFAGFVEQMRQCEKLRAGKAMLASMSPEELELVVESRDSVGHFRLHYRLGRYTYSSSEMIVKSVRGGFDLDSEHFARMVAEMASACPQMPHTAESKPSGQRALVESPSHSQPPPAVILERYARLCRNLTWLQFAAVLLIGVPFLGGSIMVGAMAAKLALRRRIATAGYDASYADRPKWEHTATMLLGALGLCILLANITFALLSLQIVKPH